MVGAMLVSMVESVGDYYASSVCLCGVLIATDSPLRGGIWSLLVLVLGCQQQHGLHFGCNED